MRKALVVGVNYYAHVPSLCGCVNDARSVKEVLERHGDGSVNFAVQLLAGEAGSPWITRRSLKDLISELFADNNDEIAIFYFAGHGHIETAGGYILTGDCHRGDDGVSLAEVLTIANKSRARNKIVVLDSCHSGIAGSPPEVGQHAVISEGLTVLTASTAEQYASEENAGGVFTRLFVDALGGAASNLVGDITPGSVYAHIDQSLGPWDQRPVFKTNVKGFVSLRRVQPPLAIADLRMLTVYFPTADFEFALDPSFEPELIGRTPGMPEPNPENTRKFAILQKLNRVNLVVPVGAPHMWHAAMNGKSCRLTVLGKHYRRLVERSRI
jgi:hypothetical protein